MKKTTRAFSTANLFWRIFKRNIRGEILFFRSHTIMYYHTLVLIAYDDLFSSICQFSSSPRRDYCIIHNLIMQYFFNCRFSFSVCVYQCEFLGCFVFLLFFFDGRDQTPGFLSFFFFFIINSRWFSFSRNGPP